MLEHLSKSADETLKLAQTIARELGKEHVGTEHLLLAMARLGQGGAGEFLTRHRLTEPTLRTYLTDMIEEQKGETWVFGRLPGTPDLKKVVEHAIGEAQVASSQTIGTNHLLLGLLHEKDCLAWQLLARAGISMDRTRAKLIHRSDPD